MFSNSSFDKIYYQKQGKLIQNRNRLTPVTDVKIINPSKKELFTVKPTPKKREYTVQSNKDDPEFIPDLIYKYPTIYELITLPNMIDFIVGDIKYYGKCYKDDFYLEYKDLAHIEDTDKIYNKILSLLKRNNVLKTKFKGSTQYIIMGDWYQTDSYQRYLIEIEKTRKLFLVCKYIYIFNNKNYRASSYTINQYCRRRGHKYLRPRCIRKYIKYLSKYGVIYKDYNQNGNFTRFANKNTKFTYRLHPKFKSWLSQLFLASEEQVNMELEN